LAGIIFGDLTVSKYWQFKFGDSLQTAHDVFGTYAHAEINRWVWLTSINEIEVLKSMEWRAACEAIILVKSMFGHHSLEKTCMWMGL